MLSTPDDPLTSVSLRFWRLTTYHGQAEDMVAGFARYAEMMHNNRDLSELVTAMVAEKDVEDIQVARGWICKWSRGEVANVRTLMSVWDSPWLTNPFRVSYKGLIEEEDGTVVLPYQKGATENGVLILLWKLNENEGFEIRIKAENFSRLDEFATLMKVEKPCEALDREGFSDDQVKALLYKGYDMRG